jgi:hypothetical protein
MPFDALHGTTANVSVFAQTVKTGKDGCQNVKNVGVQVTAMRPQTARSTLMAMEGRRFGRLVVLRRGAHPHAAGYLLGLSCDCRRKKRINGSCE